MSAPFYAALIAFQTLHADTGLAQTGPEQTNSARADSNDAQDTSSTSSSTLFEQEHLTGDWFGTRPALEDVGLTIGGEYVAEFTSVLDGGINQRGSFRNLLTLDAALDLGTAWGVEGGSLFIQYLSVNADTGGSADAGDIQVFSNIENDRSLDVIYELWYEQTLLNDRLRLKAGKVDANSEFSSVEAAADFANSSAGFSPTIFAFPSYPDPATSINIFGTIIDSDSFDLTLGYGLYDGAAAADGIRTGTRGPSTFFSDDLSNDSFHIWQGELSWNDLIAESSLLNDGRISLGGWYHDGAFDRFDGGTENGTFGVFATGEIRLFDPDRNTMQAAVSLPPSEPLESAPDRGIFLFGQYGWADERVSEVSKHLAGGVVWRGMSASRPKDRLGLYASLVDLSDEAGAGFNDDELVIDVYYRIQLAPAISVQPECQYIINPSGDTTIDDAWIAGLRIAVAF